MRERLRKEHIKVEQDSFDLKQGTGGMVDIEFLVQFLILNHACQFPELSVWTDNIRLLETLARLDLLDGHAADQLANMYRVFRAAYHRDALRERPGLISSADMVEERRMVREMWHEMIQEPEAEGGTAG